MVITAVPPLLGRTLGSEESSFVVAEWIDDGGPSDPERPRLIAPPHVHHNDDEFWYVLEGALHFKIGDRLVEARAGAGVLAPRGVAHSFWNPGPEPARYLIAVTPNTHRMLVELHAMVERSAPAVQALFRRFDCEIVG